MYTLGELLDSRIDARPVAFARLAVGLLCLLRAFEGWRIAVRVFDPATLKAPLIPGFTLPPEALPLIMGAWVISACLFTIGLWLRISGLVLVACMFTTLLMDEQLYSNHLYFLSLEVLLLTLAGADARFSPRPRKESVLAWPVILLMLQLSIVYFFSAITKITPMFLSGAVLYLNLRRVGWLALPTEIRTLRVLAVLSAVAIVTEIFLAFALWSPKYRRAAVVVGLFFHVTITLMIVPQVAVQLLIFTVAVWSLYPLFFFPLRSPNSPDTQGYSGPTYSRFD